MLLTLNPGPALSQSRHTERVVATAYCLPGKTASGPRTGEIHRAGGCIALSRDLVRTLKARFGDVIEVDGVGRFIFADLMPPKWKKRVDIYFPNSRECRVFGVKRTQIRVVESGADE